jgi:predicted metal-dependent peptidase
VNKEVENKIQSAKIETILHPDLCFFGSLTCNLEFVEDGAAETAWTDGTQLGYNPEFMAGLTNAELIGVIAHEAMHCAGSHPYRRGTRDAEKWNVACDYAINYELSRCRGITLPKGSLVCPPEFEGQSADWIYDRLPDMPKNGNGGGSGGDGQGQGAPIPGEVRDSPGQGKDENGEDKPVKSEADWHEIARTAASQAKSRGNLPAGLDRFSKAASQPIVDWKSILRRFVQATAKDDYTWTMPNSRYASQDIYLPSRRSEAMGSIAIAVDTSGSMDDVALAKAKAETLSIVEEMNPKEVHVFMADAKVHRHDVFEQGEEVIFTPAGGGGTDFRPTFKAIEDMPEAPVCVIYITDLCGPFPEVAPNVPTIFATDYDLVAPFGETVRIG